MNFSEIFIKAAELIDLEKYPCCCLAISAAIPRKPHYGTYTYAVEFFHELFKPEDAWKNDPYFGFPAKEHRVLSLLLAADIAESEARKLLRGEG